MRMRYAISTMLFWGRENPLSFEQECNFIRSYGFGVELWPSIKGEDECRYNRCNWPRLSSATEGMLVTLHSRNDEPTLEQWNEQIECAKLLNANIVTNLRSFGIPDGGDINGYDFSAEIVRLADFHKVKLCLETGNLEKLILLGEKFESVYYCFDIGYVNLDQQFTFRKYADRLAERTIHLHLNDNYGRIDDHEPPGLRSGISRENWDYLLSTLNKYDNDIIGALEMCPCSPAVMIHRASDFLFGELKWPDRPPKQTNLATINYSPH